MPTSPTRAPEGVIRSVRIKPCCTAGTSVPSRRYCSMVRQMPGTRASVSFSQHSGRIMRNAEG